VEVEVRASLRLVARSPRVQHFQKKIGDVQHRCKRWYESATSTIRVCGDETC